jgi:hypothetical protein
MQQCEGFALSLPGRSMITKMIIDENELFATCDIIVVVIHECAAMDDE